MGTGRDLEPSSADGKGLGPPLAVQRLILVLACALYAELRITSSLILFDHISMAFKYIIKKVFYFEMFELVILDFRRDIVVSRSRFHGRGKGVGDTKHTYTKTQTKAGRKTRQGKTRKNQKNNNKKEIIAKGRNKHNPPHRVEIL